MMDDDDTIVRVAVAWLRACQHGDEEALANIAATTNHEQLLRVVSGGALIILSHFMGGPEALDAGLAEWQRVMLAEEAAS